MPLSTLAKSKSIKQRMSGGKRTVDRSEQTLDQEMVLRGEEVALS